MTLKQYSMMVSTVYLLVTSLQDLLIFQTASIIHVVRVNNCYYIQVSYMPFFSVRVHFYLCDTLIYDTFYEYTSKHTFLPSIGNKTEYLK